MKKISVIIPEHHSPSLTCSVAQLKIMGQFKHFQTPFTNSFLLDHLSWQDADHIIDALYSYHQVEIVLGSFYSIEYAD